jgi:hypothetical protein
VEMNIVDRKKKKRRKKRELETMQAFEVER